MTDPTHSFEEALDSCLARLSAGDSVEACLSEFRDHAADLEPMLAAYLELRGWQPPRMSAQARATARRRAKAALRQAGRQRAAWGWGGWALRMGAAALLMAALLSSGVALAESSMPDSLLYPLKRAGEVARLKLAIGSSDQANLNLALAQRRFEEIITLAQRGQQVDPWLIRDLESSYQEAAGALSQADPDAQADLRRTYSDQIAAEQTYLDQAQGHSQALDDAREAIGHADTMVPDLRPRQSTAPDMVTEDTPQPAPTPTAAPTATPTAAPTATPTAAPTATPTATSTPTSTPTVRRRRPTAVPPTAVPPTAVPPTAVPPTAVPTETSERRHSRPSSTPPPQDHPTPRPEPSTHNPGEAPTSAPPRHETEEPEHKPTDTPHSPETPEPHKTDAPHQEQKTPEPAESEESSPAKPPREPQQTEAPAPTEKTH